MIVKNELSDIFVSILKANNFIILSRTVRPLTKGEIAYLFRQEKLTREHFKVAQDGPCEYEEHDIDKDKYLWGWYYNVMACLLYTSDAADE